MYKKVYLDNKLPIVMESLKNMRSVVIGIWVKVGSRNETTEKSGISHFLEHMYFKGTKKRTAKQVAIEIDSLGGELNAFTSREITTFYVKVLDEYLERGIELLSDLFMNSTFPEDDIDKMITLKIRGFWAIYKGRRECHIYKGSYCFKNKS